MVDEQKLRQLAEASNLSIRERADMNEAEFSASEDNRREFRRTAPEAILALLDELQTLRSERTAWRVTAENAEKDAERYRWLLANYARGDGYDAIDQALNDGEPDTQLSPAIDAAIESLKGKTP